jgi:[ribosomal protein S18]-alanine N-acetyltransferase
VHIRSATVADIPSIMELERQSATAGHWTEAQYLQAFHQKGIRRLVVVAEDSSPPTSGYQARNHVDTGPLGFLVARHLIPEWELENIVVAPAARRKGLGKRLLEVLLTEARETNSSSVFLEVRESNAAARSLYEKAGFELTGRRMSYYTNPAEDAVLYLLTLP